MKQHLIACTLAVLASVGCMPKVHAQDSESPIENLPIKKGPYKPTDSSLATYKYPKWFRDAKFGIWSHWGPQAVPRKGDWYARRMYLEHAVERNKKQDYADIAYTTHIKRYGHPSTFGYKDIVKLWKAERFDPDSLMRLYKRVGAKYFVSMGTHHDNFFLWNSKIHRWNSVKMGPHRDIVGDWQKAARKEGLYFGVSEHLAASYTWYQWAKGADSKGPYKGVPYDTCDPQYEDLYHAKAEPGDTNWLTNNPIWQRQWYDRIQELVDMYKPDLLYSDCRLPFHNVGRSMIAHYYNSHLDKAGNTQVVYNCKEESNGRFVRDVERGAMEGISEYPWQTDTSIGNWFYCEGQGYTSAKQIAQMLVDIVSKNGNLLLNIVQTPEGDLEDDVMGILNEFAIWMQDNSEGIYGTRPWTVYGEGPTTVTQQAKNHFGGIKDIRPYESTDIRFTQKDGKLYAFVMEQPTADITIKSIDATKRVKRVTMLGQNKRLKFKQDKKTGALTIHKPKTLPAYAVTTYRIEFK